MVTVFDLRTLVILQQCMKRITPIGKNIFHFLFVTTLILQQEAIAQTNLSLLFEQAGTAWNAKQYQRYLELSEDILKQTTHPAIMLRSAIAFASQGNNRQAELLIEKLISRGLTYQIDTIAILSQQFDSQKLEQLNTRMTGNLVRKDNSDTAFVIPDRHLIPEGIASDRHANFYIGSLAQWKILKGKQGTVETFIERGSGGIWSVLGIKIYDEQNELWTCAASEVDSIKGVSGLFCFDTRTGVLKKKFTVFEKDQQHLFNDLVIDNGGTIYLTDSKAGKVFRYERTKDRLDVLLDGFIYPNGIALNDQQDILYIADVRGIHQVDLRKKTKTKLEDNEATYTVGVDGLYFYKGSLIAIQDTGLQDDRVVRFYIRNGTITKTEILQSFRSDFVIPTTGTISQGAFYYIANSTLRNLKPDLSITETKQLKDPVVLKIKLE